MAIGSVASGAEDACRVVKREARVELHSPFFVFCLDTSEGLRAESWANRLDGETLALGRGPELEVDIGRPGAPMQSVSFACSGPQAKGGETGEAVFELTAKEPRLAARVTYQWNAAEAVLRKQVEIVNRGDKALDRLLNVRLGNYRTNARASVRERGFPLYLNDSYFVTLAHPGGSAAAEGDRVQLRQYPGLRLGPGQTFRCMEAVYGVGKSGEARRTFLDHLSRRMRRVVRHHDKPYAIFEPFGARPGGSFDETEAFVLDMISKVAEGQREAGCRFDLFSVDFWVDLRGDLKRCDPQRFPNGLTKIRKALAEAGIALGLWIDSGGLPAWTIGGNPAVRPCTTGADGSGNLCRATEPLRSMYTEAFRHHIRENGVRLLKFDNLNTACDNPRHDHLPGVYATEAIQNAVIEFLGALDAECPDVFLMLYWGHRSPWWLLHADTLFDSGIGIEAASPSTLPAPYVRDSITQRLDQAQWHASDVPPLGKDSLGVWLSDWPWNSSVGKERWQEGFVMDLARGSLLAQPWSDTPWLSPPERKQMAELLALLKARPDCFRNPRFILGDPWKDEPYGYCCSDGKRAFLALHNCSWEDHVLTLRPGSAWGLPDGQAWDLYRWYPEPARLRGGSAVGATASIALRPFQAVLLEAVPSGERPSLSRALEEQPLPVGFAEASRSVPVTVRELRKEPEPQTPAEWKPLDPVAFVSAGGAALTKQKDGSILASGKTPSTDTYTLTAHTDLAGITAFRLEALPDPSLPFNGPGRAVNGNFALMEFRVAAAPRGGGREAAPVALRNPAADFSQASYGGWPVAAAIDGDPKTGWSIDPQEGMAHAAVFECKEPISFPGGATLTFTLLQGEREHSMGRLKLFATTAKPPIAAPRGQPPAGVVVAGEAPASRAGGLLVVTARMTSGGAPAMLGDVGSHFSCEARLASQPVVATPVLGRGTYPAPWQAWRIPLGPSPEPRPFDLTIAPKLSPNVKLTFAAHFVPR
jgi:hypothetical protein